MALSISPAALAAPPAWPDQPPDEAFISGPGLEGRVEIQDKDALAALRLGGIEDFDAGTLAAPDVGEGYTITRYFYGGTFNFGVLHYYPDPEGGRGYVYFEDGPDLEGDHTAFHHKWLYATPAGDAAMRSLLQSLGALPASDSLPAPVPAMADRSLVRAAGWLALAASAALLSGWFVLRRKPA